MATYSHSKIKTYEQCPQKYKFRYIDRIEPPFRTIEVFLGDIVHQTIEKLYRDLPDSRPIPRNRLISYYEQRWKEDYSSKIRVVRRGTTPQDYFATGRKMVSSYYRRFYPFTQGTTVGLELDVSFPIASGTEFQGVVDRLVQGTDGAYEVHDYKTSRWLPSLEDLRRDRQLSLYELAIRQRWPEVGNVSLVWHYLAFDRQLQLKRTAEELEQAKRSALRIIGQIEKEARFPTHETRLCDWCEYYGICPAKQRNLVPVPSWPKTAAATVARPPILSQPASHSPGWRLFLSVCRKLGSVVGALFRFTLAGAAKSHRRRRRRY